MRVQRNRTAATAALRKSDQSRTLHSTDVLGMWVGWLSV